MPIPGPLPSYPDVETVRTSSPFWLRLNGVWVWLEGVMPGVGVDSDRPMSEFRALDGQRYVQRAAVARRSWSLSYRYATPAAVAALMAATEIGADAADVEAADAVWLAADPVLESNMLPRADSAGTNSAAGPVIDCAGVPLRALEAGRVVVARVRPGAPVTLSAWAAAAGDVAVIDGAAAPVVLTAVAAGRAMVMLVPVEDLLTITVADHADDAEDVDAVASAGWMLTEGLVAPPAFEAGQGMPCPVVVDEPDETLTMHHGGRYRRDYTIVLREVG